MPQSDTPSLPPSVAQARAELVQMIVDNLTQMRDNGFPTLIPGQIDALIAACALQPAATTTPTCEHCGLPLTCASDRAELIHGLSESLDAHVTRSEAECCDLRSEIIKVAAQSESWQLKYQGQVALTKQAEAECAALRAENARLRENAAGEEGQGEP